MQYFRGLEYTGEVYVHVRGAREARSNFLGKRPDPVNNFSQFLRLCELLLAVFVRCSVRAVFVGGNICLLRNGLFSSWAFGNVLWKCNVWASVVLSCSLILRFGSGFLLFPNILLLLDLICLRKIAVMLVYILSSVSPSKSN